MAKSCGATQPGADRFFYPLYGGGLDGGDRQLRGIRAGHPDGARESCGNRPQGAVIVLYVRSWPVVDVGESLKSADFGSIRPAVQ